MTSIIIKDFFQLGSLRLLSRFIKGLRGLFIITALSPYILGEYTIYLLYFFYFSCLELGISNGLERDLPHYRGQRDEEAYQKTANIGWSSFFFLSFMSSLGLAVVSFIVFREWVLALLLAGYLFTEKIYRAYDANSRIFLQYKVSGIGELTQVGVGFALVYYCLPRYGIYSIFACFITGSIIGTIYLVLFSRLSFKWNIQIGKTFEYVRKTFPLTVMIYSIGIFNYIPMTVIALIWDKATLGYYAFAFRIFQICFGIFPVPLRQVIRTRMYFNLAKAEGKETGLKDLMFPMSIYSFVISIFWLAIYWWGTFIVYRFVPKYTSSIMVLNILIFSLLPLGISKVSSDYLCSRVYNKMMLVNSLWISGIFFQIAAIFLADRIFRDIFNIVPAIYMLSTMMVYFCVVGYAFHIRSKWKESLLSMVYLFSPLAVALASVWLVNNILGDGPSLSISKNVYSSAISIAVTFAVSFWLIWPKKLNALVKREQNVL